MSLSAFLGSAAAGAVLMRLLEHTRLGQIWRRQLPGQDVSSGFMPIRAPQAPPGVPAPPGFPPSSGRLPSVSRPPTVPPGSPPGSAGFMPIEAPGRYSWNRQAQPFGTPTRYSWNRQAPPPEEPAYPPVPSPAGRGDFPGGFGGLFSPSAPGITPSIFQGTGPGMTSMTSMMGRGAFLGQVRLASRRF